MPKLTAFYEDLKCVILVVDFQYLSVFLGGPQNLGSSSISLHIKIFRTVPGRRPQHGVAAGIMCVVRYDQCKRCRLESNPVFELCEHGKRGFICGASDILLLSFKSNIAEPHVMRINTRG